MRETLQHKALQLTGPQFPSAASVSRCSKSALELSFLGTRRPSINRIHQPPWAPGHTWPFSASPWSPRERPQSLVAGSGGGSAILCLWQLAQPASPRWLLRGFAGEQRRNKIPFPSPTPRDAAAIFNLPPPRNGGKKKKRSWRVRGTYPTGVKTRTRGVVLQALRRPGSLLTSGSRHPGGVGPEA